MAVYLDHNATTPLRGGVLDAMRPYLEGAFGNPASLHRPGQEARIAVDRARNAVRELAGGPSGQVTFTGSGTEAVHLGVTGASRAWAGGAVSGPAGRRVPGHVAVASIEHRAALDAAALLAAEGWQVTRIPVSRDGVVQPDAVDEALRPDTVLVSVLHANNETGVVQPVEAIAARCRERGVLFHVDAVQSAGKIPVEAEAWGVDLVSLAAHKLGGPKGVGALWSRPGLALQPLVPGSAEGGRRGGTLNVAGIVGFAAACRALGPARGLVEAGARIASLRRELERRLAVLPGARVTGAAALRLPNTTHVTFSPGSVSDPVVALDLAGFAVSSGSACASGSGEPSHVLLAMGLSPERARTAVRVSLGTGTTEDEVLALAGVLASLVDARAAGVEAAP